MDIGMWKIVFALLFTVSAAAWADDKRDQRNIYDVFRQWLKPSNTATVDEQGTALIKRYMAALLYPVDLASFDRPEVDQKFRDAIMKLQTQLGTPATGNLTADEFDRLALAARDLDDHAIGTQPGKIVDVAKDGSSVAASSTLAGDDVTRKINHTRITCSRAENICNVHSASFDPNTSFLWLNFGPVPYKVKSWTAIAVTAVNVHASGTDTMTIDIVEKTVSIDSTGSCMSKTPSRYSLIDGGPVTLKFHQDKVSKARALVYEPARKLLPPAPDAPQAPADKAQ
jgi:hypothetical protein